MHNKLSTAKKILSITGIITGILLLSAYPAFLLTKYLVNDYFSRCGDRLVNLEKRGLLSKEFGAGWQDVLTNEAMASEAARITNSTDSSIISTGIREVDGITLSDYPSLSIIERLREVSQYSNSIEVTDRSGTMVASIRTDHQRAKISEFPPTLIDALLAAEDKGFRENELGFDFESFVRASARSVVNSVLQFKKVSPKGTSTITQQVAKLFISKLDEKGMRRVSRSVDRKIRELKLAAALRKLYTADDILEVYLNHCITSDNGMIGYKDIAKGLFNRSLSNLTDAQAVYLSRMVKWGRNVPSKIIPQCRIDMPRMGKALGWDRIKQDQVLSELDTLSFAKPRRFQGNNGPLVDLANEFWLLTLKNSGSSDEQLMQMNLIDPNSLIRKKGNLNIRLTIDLSLQKILEGLVASRGYGPDTTIIDEVRIGSSSGIVKTSVAPKDTLRTHQLLREPIDFSEPGSGFITSLNPGDSVILNIRYKLQEKGVYRRSCFYYVKRPVIVNGQYFAYSIMDSKSGELLAYFSKDRLGSKLACLLQNRTPNGSSTAKPIMNALNFDAGNFKPWQRWSDIFEIKENVPWDRTLEYGKSGKPTGVIFKNSAVKNVGYVVHNHGGIFEGCQYIFDLLSTSNNILGVETVYRLNRQLFTNDGEILPDAFNNVQFFSRIGAFSRLKDTLKLSSVTGVRVYKELARIVGVNTDSMVAYGKKIAVSDSLYSIALGTLEMNIYEQMHLFNCLYNNDIIERPADHPSLVIQSITLNGDTVQINDTIRRFHPFSDINNIRPTLLGLHKRLVSNRGDGLMDYDIAYTPDSSYADIADTAFTENKLWISEPLSNFAKSGTSDDVFKPFNESAASKKRTNYCIWNAVIRVDFSRLSGYGEQNLKDITIACIGEGNTRYTGERDGKTLHKFLSRGLLQIAGVKNQNGYFTQYEQYLKNNTPVTENCGNDSTEESLQINSVSDLDIEKRGD